MIRIEQEEDHDKVYRLNKQAFGQPDESELVNALRRSENFIPELSLVLQEEGEIIGYILFTKLYIGSYETLSLSLAPMAVHPEYQSKGYGSQLIHYGLDKARDLGYDSVVVLGHPEYYPRFGFKKASEWSITCPIEVPDEAFMALELKVGSLSKISGQVKYAKEFGI